MNIFCLGINHRTAPIEIREKFWYSSDEIRAFLPVLKQHVAQECVLISTCNRTELYYLPQEQSVYDGSLWQMLASQKNASNVVREENFYSLSSLNAVKHLFNVASGIDSMVLGDVQILGQTKEAFTIAQQSRCTGIFLHRLFQTAFHVGKRVKTETEISEGAVSISYAAAELASKIFEDLSRHTALLIGAGETGKLTAKHLVSRNVKKLIIANRTRQRAEELSAQLGGLVIEFEDMAQQLQHVDIAISSVESHNYILSTHDLHRIMKLRGNKPLFIIDLGVPRNIDPSANAIDNVFLHDIDALNHIVDNNLAHRKAEIPKVQHIVMDELIQFNNWYNSLQVTPTIQELRERFESIRENELKKHRHHFPLETQSELDTLTKRIINKILHTPMVNLRNGTGELEEDETRRKVHIIRTLFGLDKKKTE
ncbi:MAG: glutamyl-tRNA reductase [Ignavibacteriae bacterium]|nr:glutamyl-tRNA reductase [Ignavibacteriota bacterium]